MSGCTSATARWPASPGRCRCCTRPARRISAQHLAEIHEVAIKAAVKDQELAGIGIVSDGELRRDNDVDYFLARIPGVHIPQRAKTDYFDYYEAEVTRPLPELPDGAETSAGIGLAADFRFTRALTERPVKFSFTGPFSLSRRIRDGALGFWTGGGPLRTLAPARGSPMTLSAPGPTAPRP